MTQRVEVDPAAQDEIVLSFDEWGDVRFARQYECEWVDGAENDVATAAGVSH